MSRGRDSQRVKVYRAEWGTFKYTTDFTTVRQAQKYANSVTSSRWYRRLGGPKFVLVKPARSDSNTSTAWAERNEIRLATDGFSKWVVLHELAHIAMWHVNRRLPAHGQDFALVYRRMIEEFLGDEQRALLAEAYDREGVKAGTGSSAVLKALAAAEE